MSGGCVLSDDCLAQLVRYLDVGALSRAGSVCKEWAEAAAGEEIWLNLYREEWGDTDMVDEKGEFYSTISTTPPDTRTIKTSFLRRNDSLKLLPNLLLRWKDTANNAVINNAQRQEWLQQAEESTKELMRCAVHCEKILVCLAADGVKGKEEAKRMAARLSSIDTSISCIAAGTEHLDELLQQSALHTCWLLADRRMTRKWQELFEKSDQRQQCLEAGALIVCEIEGRVSSQDQEWVSNELNAIANDVRHRLTADVTEVKTVVEAMNTVIFSQRGFRGNTEHYYDPRNSYLTHVLKRCTGIPISLAVVYMCVAERLGVQITGVNAPTHFLLQVQDSSAEGGIFYVDVFDSGTILTYDGVVRLLAQRGWVSDSRMALPACSPRALFGRMLRNLTAVYQGNHQEGAAKFMLCLAQLLCVVESADRGGMHYERQIDQYRWTGTARILNP